MVRRRSVRVAGLAGCVLLAAGLAAGVWQAFGRGRTPEPPAPAPPPPPRTTAELLVGTWRWVKLSDLVGPPPWTEKTFEYTGDGRVIIRYWFDVGPAEPQIGTYRLDGDILHLHITHQPDKVRRQSTRIVKLDDKVFVNTDADTTGRFIAEYERVG